MDAIGACILLQYLEKEQVVGYEASWCTGMPRNMFLGCCDLDQIDLPDGGVVIHGTR